MQGAKDLLGSERGVFCLLVLIAATLLAILKIITGADWLTFSQAMMLALVGSKTMTGALDQWLNKPAAVSAPTAQS